MGVASADRGGDGRARRWLASGCILAAGWGAAAVVAFRAPPEAESADLLEMRASKQYAREIERIGGKAAALTSELDDALASLSRGRGLAVAIAAGTTVAAAVCAPRRRR